MGGIKAAPVAVAVWTVGEVGVFGSAETVDAAAPLVRDMNMDLVFLECVLRKPEPK